MYLYFTFLFIFGQLSLSSSRESPNVDFQIHSNNDLRELSQSLIKGARRFKFDPHYTNNREICKYSDSCFILSHDQPIKENVYYNTSDDLLNILASDEFRSITKNERVTIALCFKSAPDKCQQNSSEFANWLSLADDFYNKALSSNPTNVEIILDGDGIPVNCLVGRWLPWNSVWITTPADAFYSNTTENDYYRFEVLNDNENEANWEWMASPEINYGKFSNGSYPYQLWEPDAQTDIIEYINIYRGGQEHPPGFHFAINSDIAMFRVYSSSTSLNSDIDVAVGMNSLVHQGSSTPLIVGLSSTLFVAFFQNGGDVLYNFISFDSAAFSNKLYDAVVMPTEVSSWLFSASVEGVVNASISQAILLTCDSANVVNNMMKMMLISTSGHMVVFDITIEDFASIIADSFVMGKLNDGSTEITIMDATLLGDCSKDMSNSHNPGKLITKNDFSIVTLSNSKTRNIVKGNKKFFGDEESLIVTRYNLTISGSTVQANLVAQAQIYVASGKSAFSSGEIHSARISFISEDASHNSSKFLVFIASNHVVLVTELYATRNPDEFSIPSQWVVVSVGEKIAVSYDAETDVLMLLNDGGYCYNSHTHNTRATPSLCSSTPVSTPAVLDYTVAFLSDWLEYIQTSPCTQLGLSNESHGDVAMHSFPLGDAAGALSCFMASPCSARMMHGSYDQGTKPAVALTRRTAVRSDERQQQQQQQQQRAVSFLAVHQGYADIEKHAGGCGEPIHRDGVVLDSFDIDDWMTALKR